MSEIDSSLLLTNEDRAGGYSITADGRHNISLLRWSQPVTWFSSAVTEETLRAFLEMLKACERSAKGDNVNVSVIKTE